MKIYTRSGDEGTTALYGGERVGKDSARVAAYGSVDEANAHLGVARAALPAEGLEDVDDVLAHLQHALFDVGADLATPMGAKVRSTLTPVTEDLVEQLERTIDRFDGELVPLTKFLLPGGHPSAAALHVARTVLRRAERDAVAAGHAVELNPRTLVVLNRASDLCFIVARVVNARTSVEEPTWTAGASSPRAG
jgi:cob(I)alamin adenosyltransferase